MAISSPDPGFSESTLKHFDISHLATQGLALGSLTGLQSQMFLVFLSWVPVLKVGVLDMEYEPFAPQGEAPNLQVPFQLWVSQPEVKFVVRAVLATCLLVCPIWWSSFTSSRLLCSCRNCAIFSCRFAAAVGGSEFVTFLCLLGLHFLDIFFNISRHPQILNRNNYRNNGFWSSFTLLRKSRERGAKS